jgi:hypothetical protein
MLWPTCVMTAWHVHNVRTGAEYRAKQAQLIASGRLTHPGLTWRDPWDAGQLPVVVESGKWLVHCPCGNYPSVLPEARLACCFECGAVYADLVMPEETSAIEAALLERAHPALRAWRPGETVETLRAQSQALAVAGRVVAAMDGRR